MINYDKAKKKIDKRKEMRTQEISEMIDEGGLGADRYYDVIKGSSPTEKEIKSTKKYQK
ncbi:hypothetical protein [Oceanobacillus oncorhynchi]|uniref:hypothetical protein n=1 Tax=Oceanobacillus oncorhynchi TaxID=545501 RepID=UPI002115E404|nr:hypothetical protein [Oceanobacillus oncorhynchi]MDM8100267.1 hypothetical protein [Oceanobacillus oncorhynchi]UUI40918.1 hypothetical protein NP440_04830 [Oceanobacillus oncorhynchi]